MAVEYRFGECKICKRFASLKNGVCVLCELKEPETSGTNTPDFFEQMFGERCKWGA